MKFKLLKDLPFIKKDIIFGTGCWVGGGYGIDMGNSPHGSHNGTKTFSNSENAILDSIRNNMDWIKQIPTHIQEAFELYDKGRMSRSEIVDFIKGASIA